MYYEINEDSARRAKEANSFREYASGSTTSAYRKAVDEAKQRIENHKKAVREIYHEKIDRLFNAYCRALANNINDQTRIDASYPSILIAGASKFSNSKKDKQNAARERNIRHYHRVENLLTKALGVGTGGISSSEANAIELIDSKINALRSGHADLKKASAYYRKHKNLEGCEISRGMKEQLERSIHCTGFFPSYRLSYSLQEIKRLEDRKKSLELVANSTGDNVKSDFFEVIENKDLMRLQLIFDGKPDEATRSAIKRHGFKWSPKNGAWQRLLNANAIRAAKELDKALSI